MTFRMEEQDIGLKRLRLLEGRCLTIKIETLIPDFQGNTDLIRQVCEARPNVLAHNLETVESLQNVVRPQCRYEWSLNTLKIAAATEGVIVKSGLMLGLGEKREEVIQTMKDLVSMQDVKFFH